MHPSAWSAASYQGNHWAAVNGDHLVPIHTVGRSLRANVIFMFRKEKRANHSLFHSFLTTHSPLRKSLV